MKNSPLQLPLQLPLHLLPQTRRFQRRLAPLGLALFFCAGLAQAQFVWITPNGTRQYSDQPPPPGTPASKILKTPGRAAPAQPEAPAAAVAAADNAADVAAAAAAAPAAKKPPTLAEREAEYRKRSKERQEAEKLAQASSQAAAARAANCQVAQQAQRTYDSGTRIAEVGPDGQQRFLDDAERAQRKARAESAAARDCR